MDDQQEFTPRPYQITLYEKSIAENSIIYLPTGSGKTYIAVLVIVKLSGPLHKPYAKDGKRTIFIVNTVALVQQQCNYLARHTGLIVKGYSGDQQVDRWTRKEWLREITSSQIMVMTAQIFLDLLEHGTMPLSKVNLLIFDECHHAVKDHPMRQIMQRFENWPVNQHPRVLGLSASLLNANVTSSNLEITLKELEITLHSKIITLETFSTVSVFSTKPKELIEYYDALKEHGIMSSVSSFIASANLQLECLDLDHRHGKFESSSSRFRPESTTSKLTRIFSDISQQLKELGLYGVLKSIMLHRIRIDTIRTSHIEENFPGISDILNTHLMKIQKLISDNIEYAMSEEFLYDYASPKVFKLVEVLKKFYHMQKDKNKFCCIIFVERRFTAKVLYHILKELSLQDENFNFLKPDYILGQNNDPSINAREQLCLSKWDKQVLLKFRNGTINCLVATSVIDEGIDIPLCTLVVRFYAPMDCRSYIQSKGRARHSTSHYVILVPHGDNAYEKRYNEYKKTEEALQKALLGRSTRQAPTHREIDETLYDYEIEPYVIMRTDGRKSVITEQNAISLINTYCSSLSSSRYTNALPIWIQEDIDTLAGPQFRVHLSLPVTSPLKETLKSDQFPSLTTAKRAAAFKACLELHRIGELDDNLMPKLKSAVVEPTDFLYPHMQNMVSANSKIECPLTYPKAWFAAYPKENVILYLHVIEMIPINSESTGKVRHLAFHDIFINKNTYGILSTKKMPEIPAFPIFTNTAGCFHINIKINNLTSPLTKYEIDLLKQFHYLIFDKILDVSKDFTIFDNENQENCFLIVPVSDAQKINWDVVKNYNHISTDLPSKPLKVKTSDYKHSLVLPTYRSSGVYLVTEICNRMTPNSPFAIRSYDSYAHYFKMKHNLAIENLDQPLLEVRPLSTEMNFLKPRNMKAPSNNKEHLVPELCQKISFPTVYWLKAAVLPSVLHRTSQLLVAEDLRVSINHEAGLKFHRSLTDKWDPMVVVIAKCEEISNTNNEIAADGDTSTSSDLDLRISSNVDSGVGFDDLTLNKSLYTWVKEQEPLDLERNADTLKPEDLVYYKKFMSQETHNDRINWRNHNEVSCNYSFSERIQEPPLQMLTKTSTQGPSPVDIMQSLTAKMSNDVLDYERLETLGDAFLKYSISLYLYQNFPNYGENSMTRLKEKIVSNSNLFGCGQLKNLDGKMNIEEFSPKENFKVPACSVDKILRKLLRDTKLPGSVLSDLKIPQAEKFAGVIGEETLKRTKENLLIRIKDRKTTTGTESFLGLQVVAVKCIADCVEALLGVYLTRSGVEDAVRVMKWLEILPKITSVEDLLYSAVQDPRKGTGYIDQFAPWAPIIEKRIGYTFRNRAFLLQAFTHQTFTSNRITDCYERLEFLGDAILDFILTVHIYETCGNLNPGELTDLRSALVNNITFACLSVRYGLHTALLAYEPALFAAIDKFVKFQENRDYKVDDELLLVLSEEEDCNMAEYMDVPKVLGDLFESLIAAVYLDSEKNLKLTWHVVYNLMKNEIEAFSKKVPKQPTRLIYEATNSNPTFAQAEVVEGTTTVMVTLAIHVGKDRKYFHGFGASKKVAQCAASKQALKYLKIHNKL